MTERDRLITLRLSEEEHLRFKTVAEDMGMPVSTMLRALVRAQEKQQGVDGPRRRRTPSK